MKYKKITILGAMPPTIGGVSIHVERLADSLMHEGWDVRIFDLFTPGYTPSDKPYPVVRGRRLFTWLKLFLDGPVRRPSVTHVHFSSGRRLPLMALYLRWTTLWSRLVLTVHSGSAEADMSGYSPLAGWLAGFGLNSAARIVCVNLEIIDYLTRRFPKLTGRLRHVVPFIAYRGVMGRRKAANGAPVLLASGYGTSLYEWLTLIEACDKVAGLGEVHLVFYNTYDSDYFPRVEAACARNPGKYRIHKDLTPDEFAALLAGVDCFIRPTLTDGDSIAVREALALGIPVVASDCVTRPEGCLLFPVRDADALRKVLESAARKGFPSPTTTVRCGGSALRALYAEVLNLR